MKCIGFIGKLDKTKNVITASDISLSSTEIIEIINVDQPIATLSAGGTFKMEMFIRNGVGYVNANENKKFCKEGNNRVIGRLGIKYFI